MHDRKELAQLAVHHLSFACFLAAKATALFEQAGQRELHRMANTRGARLHKLGERAAKKTGTAVISPDLSGPSTYHLMIAGAMVASARDAEAIDQHTDAELDTIATMLDRIARRLSHTPLDQDTVQ